MTSIFFNRTIYFLIAVCTSANAAAQSKTTVKASVDRSQIVIGERIQLTLEAEIPENQPIRFFQIDSLPHFEIINLGKIDTNNTGSGTSLSRKIQITSFDSGHWVLPSFPLGETIATDSIPVDIGFSAPFDPQQPYHDIKDITEVKPIEEEKKKNSWWIFAVAVLLAAGLVFFFLRRSKPKPKPVAAPVDPYKRALEQLEKLRKEKLTPKAFYSGLTDIFRTYVEKRKDIRSLQQTTGDLVVQLKTAGIEDLLYRELAETLQLSDSVKFAKYETSSADDISALNTIKRTIDHIEQSIRPAETQPAS